MDGNRLAFNGRLPSNPVVLLPEGDLRESETVRLGP
jgi:hypothetical protein